MGRVVLSVDLTKINLSVKEESAVCRACEMVEEAIRSEYRPVKQIRKFKRITTLVTGNRAKPRRPRLRTW